MSASPHVQSPLMNVQRGAVERSFVKPALAILIGALFVYTGATKAWDPLKFANDISHFHILPYPVGIRLAFYLPWLEIFCGLALIFGRLRAGGSAILLALTAIFIVALVSARLRGIDINCGCFGSAGKGLSFGWHMVIDLVLLAGLFALCFWPFASRPTARS